MAPPKLEINMDAVYQSNGSGPFIIIEDLGVGYIEGCTTKHRLVKVRFLNTGAERVVRYNDASRGAIKDLSNIITVGKIYESNNSGPYEVIEDLGMNYIEGAKEKVRLFKVKFINTGYIGVYRHAQLISRELKDPYTISTYKVGYIGEPDYSRSDYNLVMNRWRAMMGRCYNPDDVAYNNYGGAGVTVDVRWHNFANFLEDVQYLSGYAEFIEDPDNYHLDKDILQRGTPTSQRVYSRDTCQFINKRLNFIQVAVDYSDTHENKYVGVQYKKDRKCYVVIVRINGKGHYVGRFIDPIMAANCYNYYVISHGLNWPLNEGVPCIPIEEVAKANLMRRDLCIIVDKNKDKRNSCEE